MALIGRIKFPIWQTLLEEVHKECKLFLARNSFNKLSSIYLRLVLLTNACRNLLLSSVIPIFSQVKLVVQVLLSITNLPFGLNFVRSQGVIYLHIWIWYAIMIGNLDNYSFKPNGINRLQNCKLSEFSLNFLRDRKSRMQDSHTRLHECSKVISCQ